MNAIVAKRQIDRMIGMKARCAGDQVNAVDYIAKKAGLGFWTVDNIRTGKTKRVFSDVRDAIRLAYLDMCAGEVRKWQRELDSERAKGRIDDDLEDMEREAADFAARVAKRRARIGGGQ